MGLTRYPSYKPSGIEWIGEIPSHWQPLRLKYLGTLYNGLTGKGASDFNQAGNPGNKAFIPFKNIANNFRIDPANLESVSIVDDDRQNQVEKNDIFFMMSSENYEDVGKSSILSSDLGETYLNSFCRGFRVHHADVNPLFLNYLLGGSSYRQRLLVEANGFTRINLKVEKVNDHIVVMPPIAEQTAIAAYLDEKTAQIDKLIAAKQRMIELLREERQAVINEAVNGEGKKGWVRRKLKYVARLQSGEFITSEQIKPEGQYPVYGGNGFRGCTDTFTHDGNYILIGRQGALCGNINYANNKFFASEHAVVVTILDKEDEILWLGELLRSMNLNQYSLASAQPGLSVERIENLEIQYTSTEEQKSVVKNIRSVINREQKNIERLERELSLLSEWRSTLISEIVTGKFKVA